MVTVNISYETRTIDDGQFVLAGSPHIVHFLRLRLIAHWRHNSPYIRESLDLLTAWHRPDKQAAFIIRDIKVNSEQEHFFAHFANEK